MVKNTNDLYLDVVYGTGTKGNILVRAGELFADEKGLVVNFKIKFNDGVIGHFVLMPDDAAADMALLITEKILIPLGITFVSGRLMQGSHQVISTLASTGNKYITIPYVQKMCSDFRQRQHSYYAIGTGECVFKYPIVIEYT